MMRQLDLYDIKESIKSFEDLKSMINRFPEQKEKLLNHVYFDYELFNAILSSKSMRELSVIFNADDLNDFAEMKQIYSTSLVEALASAATDNEITVINKIGMLIAQQKLLTREDIHFRNTLLQKVNELLTTLPESETKKSLEELKTKIISLQLPSLFMTTTIFVKNHSERFANSGVPLPNSVKQKIAEPLEKSLADNLRFQV